MSTNSELLAELGLDSSSYRNDPRNRQDARTRVDNREVSASERIPMSDNKMKLDNTPIPGYRTRWFNDTGERIERAKKGGYTHVTKADLDGRGAVNESAHTDLGAVVSMVVGSQENGQPMRAYRMKIREEWYIQDQAAKALEVKKVEAQIRRGNLPGDQGDTSNRYVPDEGISIEE